MIAGGVVIRYSSDGDAIVYDGDFDDDDGTSCGYRAVGHGGDNGDR